MDEKAALDRLVVEHLPAALRFAVRLTGDADEAEDLVQDALVRVTRGWAAFRGEANFRTWLFRIVVNAFRDRLRRPRMEILDKDVDDLRGAGPAQAALQRELGELVAQNVSRLPPRQREVLVLTMYEQLPAREVATVLGISEANVYSSLHQARARLRKELAEYLEEQ
ncbi:MAG TPA: sigma-70 family RNA polymerase sigma factor [Pirellulales bacterium]|nr:sigma-70 family RNA polymerase sigma factor [Pirellulales bacterium]